MCDSDTAGKFAVLAGILIFSVVAGLYNIANAIRETKGKDTE